jgi:hypothetical protein
VIDVRVADEHVADAEDLPRAQGVDLADVEQERPALVQETEIEDRVPEPPVDQPSLE